MKYLRADKVLNLDCILESPRSLKGTNAEFQPLRLVWDAASAAGFLIALP